MHFDCLILGSGPAGLYSALSCAKRGFSTAIVENRAWGGTGFRDGCLPVKKILDDFKVLKGHNIFVENEGKLKEVESRITGRLKSAGVTTFLGNGTFVSDHVFRLSDMEITADNIIIATGTRPSSPEGVRIDSNRIITHREAIMLSHPPEDLIIIGGNVEGVEFASLFSAAGTKVTIIEQDQEILPGNDRDLIAPLIEFLTTKGVVFKTDARVATAYAEGGKVSVSTSGGEKLSAEKVLVTGFRLPNIPDGIENTGIVHTKEGIPVDSKLQTGIQGIFAVGDINGIHGMAHIALQQGLFIPDAIEGREVPRRYETLPRAMFTIPEIAGAGKQEWELKNTKTEYRAVRIDIKDTWRGFSRGIKQGFIKLLFGNSDVLLGIWMCGDDASEVMSMAGLLLDGRVSKNDILNNLFIHPSLGEGVLEAALKL